MNLPLISLLALLAAIAIGYARKLNTGIISIGFAFVVGYFVVGMTPGDIVNGWPLRLFFILLAMTLLFSIASVNGTLRLIAQKVTHMVGGNRKLIPIVFFFMSAVLAAIGPGNISICALVLPIALAVSSEEKISPLLMATMVIAGSNAGGLSPIAPTGVIGVTLARDMGLETGMTVFSKQIIGHSLLAIILYLLLKGYSLKNNQRKTAAPPAFDKNQLTTIGVILLVVAGIIVGKLDIGLAAFLGASILLLLKVADESKAIASVPWPTLMLVCGVGMLVNVCRFAGGIDYLTQLLATVMNAHTVAPVMTITSGLMSTVSSASGVVMPTLIPTVPNLVKTTGGDAANVISAIIMGAHVATNSPLSTLGALAVASACNDVDREKLFRELILVAIGALIFAAAIVYIGIV